MPNIKDTFEVKGNKELAYDVKNKKDHFRFLKQAQTLLVRGAVDVQPRSKQGQSDSLKEFSNDLYRAKVRINGELIDDSRKLKLLGELRAKEFSKKLANLHQGLAGDALHHLIENYHPEEEPKGKSSRLPNLKGATLLLIESKEDENTLQSYHIENDIYRYQVKRPCLYQTSSGIYALKLDEKGIATFVLVPLEHFQKITSKEKSLTDYGYLPIAVLSTHAVVDLSDQNQPKYSVKFEVESNDPALQYTGPRIKENAEGIQFASNLSSSALESDPRFKEHSRTESLSSRLEHIKKMFRKKGKPPEEDVSEDPEMLATYLQTRGRSTAVTPKPPSPTNKSNPPQKPK